MIRVFYFYIMIDFLIVGNGLAGVCFAEVALQKQKTIHVLDSEITFSSKVAAGLYNPVVLKRFSEVWKAKEQLEFAIPFYKSLEHKFNVKLDYAIPLYRKFASIEEQNNWFQAADKPNLTTFLSSELVQSKLNHIDAPLNYGLVNDTGYLDIKLLLNYYSDYLKEIKCFTNENFTHVKLEVFEEYVQYEAIKARHIVFAEGFNLTSNPFFQNLPMDGTKGELLLIKAPDLNLEVIVKSSIFIFPVGNDLYKVGATYNWSDKTNTPTQEARQELIKNLKDLIKCDFEIVSHLAGIRPTIKDRRPLVGTHYQHNNVHVLNGLGTRGVMLGPFLAKQLYNSIDLGIPLDLEIDVKRIYKKRNLI